MLQKMTDILQHRGQQQWYQGLQLSDLFSTQFRIVGGNVHGRKFTDFDFLKGLNTVNEASAAKL